MNDIANWVKNGPTTDAKEFRQSVHVILKAIAESDSLSSSMVLKGGILLALMYDGKRFTKDIDFSTKILRSDFNLEGFCRTFDEALAVASEELGYGVDCRLQSKSFNPKSEDAHFPTLQIKIGHAYFGTRKHERLKRKECPTTITIDYSFNEMIVEDVEIEFETGVLIAYTMVDLVAEKLRAILQQEERNRFRRQDPYDIFMLIKGGYLDDETLLSPILKSLLVKSATMSLAIDKYSILNTEVNYHGLTPVASYRPSFACPLSSSPCMRT